MDMIWDTGSAITRKSVRISIAFGNHVKADIVEPLKFFFDRTDCHALMIKPIGRGNDERQAWAAFDYAAGAVADAIQKGRKGRSTPGSAPQR